MFRKIFEARKVVKNVLKKENYFILFLSASIIIFVVFYLLTLATVTNQSLKIFIMMNGFLYTLSTFIILAVIAILFAIYISLFAYKIKNKCKGKKVAGIFGGGGLIAGLFGAGCPMCGAALFALIGMPLALFFLPFKGLEIRLLALILLSISVYMLSRSLIKCKLKN